ncbi:hypothetical protein KY334_07280 [Candidatus Woesearchaeota archaeon]|nr:hypothetical protein [Candidatus Woesearchaeota archaeon]
MNILKLILNKLRHIKFRFNHYKRETSNKIKWRYRRFRRELRNLKNKDYRYYKYYYERRILSSKPIICEANDNFELHILSCKKNLLDSLWSLKTFYHYSGLKSNLVIHSDGSLTKRDKRIYLKHFKNCKIIERDEATNYMETCLKEYPISLSFRKRKPFYCSLKLFDPLFYSSNDNILYIDSDILFFKKPQEIIDYINKRIPFFNSDMEDSYSCSRERLNELFNKDVCKKFNAGLMYFNKKEYLKKLDFIEDFFKTVYELKIMCSVGPNHHEQTLHAILAKELGSKRLHENYQPGNIQVNDKTVSCHFFSGGYPLRFYTVGLKLLKNNNFLEEFNKN